MASIIFNDFPKFFLAPMAGISNVAFRLLAKEYGADLVSTEMISAEGIVRGNPKTLHLAATIPKERPVAIQIFGNNADTMARAAQIIEAGADVIDLNFGCPARKIVSGGSGAALLKHPELIGDIVSKVVKSVSRPVTAKVRSGWDEKSKNAVEVARIAEDSGAAAIIVHPRTRSQGFSGLSDWNVIADVKKSVSIPVIGNGDVNSPESAKAMLELTGCDGVMIGRGALGNPWIFSRTIQYIKTGRVKVQEFKSSRVQGSLEPWIPETLEPSESVSPPPTQQERIQCLLKFARSLADFKGEYIACREIRKFVKWFTRGMPQTKELRQTAMHVENIKELEDILMRYITVSQLVYESTL